MDNAIWATYFDLDTSNREVFLEWTIEKYFPILQELIEPKWIGMYKSIHPGERFEKILNRLHKDTDVERASGSDYILLLGAETTRSFYDPSPRMIYEKMGNEDKQILDKRKNVKDVILTEEWRINGPESSKREVGTVPSRLIQMGRYDARENDDDLQEWYAQERMLGVSSTPGCIGARKMIVTNGTPRHSVIYEFVSFESREEHYVALEETEWTKYVHSYLLHPPGSPLVAERIYPS